MDRAPSRLAVLRRRAPRPGARTRGVVRRICRAARRGRGGRRRCRVPAARARAGRRPGGCAIAFRPPTAARCRRSIRARCASRAKRSRIHDGLADFAFAMQGLGSGAITLAGHAPRSARAGCPRVARGDAIAAFALSEPDAGSDVARDGDARGARRRRTGCSTAARRGSPTAASPTSTACSRAPATAPGAQGHFRVRRARRRARTRRRRAHRRDRAASAGAPRVSRLPGAARRAARARRATASSSRCARSTSFARRWRRRPSASRGARSTRRVAHARARRMFGGTLADLQLDAGDAGRHGDRRSMPRRFSPIAPRGCATCADVRTTKEAAMAKLAATESAQRVIDAAVQMHGGAGRHARAHRRAALPRNPRAAHLRGRDRGAAAHHRPRSRCAEQGRRSDDAIRPRRHVRARPPAAARRSGRTSCSTLPELRYPGAAQLRDRAPRRRGRARLGRAHGDPRAGRLALDLRGTARARRTGSRTCCARTSALVPGNRVLLRGPNSPMMAACWFAVIKAGGIAVATMPLLRAQGTDRHRDQGADHARAVRRAAADELDAARAACPTLTTVAHVRDRGARRRRGARGDASRRCSPNVAHGRRRHGADRVHVRHDRHSPRARCIFTATCSPPAIAGRARRCARRPTTSSPAARRWRSRSGWADCCCSRCASARRRCCSRRPSPDALLPAIAEHRATVLFTAPTSYRAMAAQARAVRPRRACASACRPARRCRPRRASCGRTRPASR